MKEGEGGVGIKMSDSSLRERPEPDAEETQNRLEPRPTGLSTVDSRMGSSKGKLLTGKPYEQFDRADGGRAVKFHLFRLYTEEGGEPAAPGPTGGKG